MRAMVSTPTRAWRLPGAPATLGAQIEACFVLWARSALPALPFALLYSLAGMLPLLTLGDLGARLLKTARDLVVYAFDPRLPEPASDPMESIRAVGDWLAAPSTLGLVGLALLFGLYGITGLLLRQQRIALGQDRGLGDAAVAALRHLPAAFAAWLVYGLAMLACVALLFGFAVPLFFWAFDLGLVGLLALLVLFLFGSVLLSVPLVWASVVFGYAPVLAALDGRGPFAAHAASARLVRGHWARAATLMTVPLLVYLGVGGTLSSTVYTVLGLAVFSAGGMQAVLDGGWLAWGQGLAAVPMALALPLACAGFLVSLHDLQQLIEAPG
jgi:hypothetical protein